MLPPGVRFRQPQRARRSFSELAAILDRGTLKAVGSLLPQTPDPDASLERLERLVASTPEGLRQVQDSRRALHAALVLFSHSSFLSGELARRPELLAWALEPEQFYATPGGQELYAELGVLRTEIDDEQAAAALARLRRAHILRIALRDLLGVATLAETILALSNLADAVLEGAHDFVHADLVRRFGRPLVQAGDTHIEGRFVALALGKLGGRELNYSSDIDLMYLHTGQGETAGPVKTTNHDFYRQLATRVTSLLNRMTPEGFAYRVDLRLRPEGTSGELVSPLEGALAYYNKRARDWELQMLIKARPAAGDLRLGESFLEMVQPLIYRTTTDFSLIERVSESRDRIHRDRRRAAGKQSLDVKLDHGGIRDIEFLVQCLQRLHGGQDPFVRSGGTLFALHRLREKSYITLPDYAALSSAYQYLRTVEHRLQLVDDRQVHELPASEEERAMLRRRLGQMEPDTDLEEEVAQHFRAVSAIYKRTIHAQSVSEGIPSDSGPDDSTQPPLAPGKPWLRQLRQIELHSPALARRLDELTIRRGAQLFEVFLDKVAASAELARRLEDAPDIVHCVGDLFEHSAYAGEHLVRYPFDIAEIAGAARQTGAWNGDSSVEPGDHPDLEALLDPVVAYTEKSMLLRRSYRRRQLRILAESVCGGAPIFQTLACMSGLAEEVIRAAYRIAQQAQQEQHPEWRPTTQLYVIALGRLGIRELDLGSDVDLVFALPDEGAGDLPYWRDFAARFIELISNYTREGRIFAVDTRLRPNGRDGAIVQTASGFKRYFAERADAWEALAYMKARTVAGDVEGGRRFLMDLQRIGWDRFGRNADLATWLRDMRSRIETERAAAEPVKAGPGGYFDIDFILLFLRLKSAGLFFEFLSTPKRIAIVRQLGGLSEEQARFLEEAAIFLRAVDHAVRVVTGRAAGDIPAAAGAQESVRELVSRWSSLVRTGQPFSAIVEHVKRRTRTIYREVVAGRSAMIIPAARAPRG